MSGRELNVLETLGQIESTLAKERADGLANLEHILKYNKNNHVLQVLKDKTWHKIYEALFSCAAIERSTSLSKSTKLSSKAAIERLETCAKVLRIAVTAGLRTIRNKTVVSLLDHIVQTLPLAEGGYCKGLSLDYVKCLRIVCEYQPHVEHLRDKWDDIIDFCLDGLSMFQDRAENNGLGPPGSNSTSSLRASNGSLSHRSRAGTPKPTRTPASSDLRREADDLVVCIWYLTRPTNIPLTAKGSEILEALILYLKSTDGNRVAHHDAFAAINSVLSKISHSTVTLPQSTILDLYPVIKNLWPAKASGLKDEMLVTLILTKTHVSTLLELPGRTQFHSDLENLLDILRNDYTKRHERDQLQVDDIQMEWQSTKDQTSLAAPTFRLRRGNTTAENRWTIAYFMAFYSHLIDGIKRRAAVPQMDSDNNLAKKPRLSYPYQDYLRQATLGPVSSQICALQILAFLSQLSTFTEDEVQEFINKLTAILTDHNGAVASWAMLALSACALQKYSGTSTLQPLWTTVFQHIARTVVTSSCSRAACHLMNVLLKLKLVQYSSTASVLESMLSSVELHGPAIFADSSASLWTTLMQLKSSENPGAVAGMSERVLRWAFNKWTPSKLDDRVYAAQAVATHRPCDLIDLLDICSDRPISSDQAPKFLCNGHIAQAWHRMALGEPLSKYLLLFDNEEGRFQSENDQSRSQESNNSSFRSSFAADLLIIESCLSETERVISKWSEWANDRPQSLLPEMIGLVVSLCLVNGFVTARQDERNKRRLAILQKTNENLIRRVTSFLARPDCDQDRIDAVLDLIIDCLPSLGSLPSLNTECSQEGSVSSFALHLSRSLELRRESKMPSSNPDEDELMGVDDEFDSQISEQRAKDNRDNAARDGVMVTSDISSFRSCAAAYIYLVSCTIQSLVEAMDTDDTLTRIPSSFIARMNSLSDSEFCACRPILSMIAFGSLPLLAADLDSVLEHIALSFLEPYEFERYEVPKQIELDFLNGCATLWTDSSDPSLDELNETASMMYEWFVIKGLAKNLCSPDVQLAVADLFFTLLEVRGPDYKPLPTLPSVRTGLFELLRNGEVLIKYHISKNLSLIFRHFTLGEHETILDDLKEILPETPEWIEGLAMRLLVLSRLASDWHTLLRRCVFYIFETAALVGETRGYATYCIANVATSLGLEPRALFNLFAQQTLYTWLKQHTLSAGLDLIPFVIFGYSSLADLLQDAQEEIFAQVAMRSDEKDMAVLSAKLSSSQAELLIKNFSKTAAYCLASDIENNTDTKSKPIAETKIKALLGKQYLPLLQLHFPNILGTLLYATDQDDYVGKGLAKKAHTEKAALALQQMQVISASTARLPAAQQPLFRPRLLSERMDRLSRRTGVDKTVWSPEIYVFVLRALLSKIHPALGSLHACAVVRKIRILVALSGEVAFLGYPLEMTLHALRPLLIDKQCADDALGIFQYLLGHGVPHLVTQISFVSGLVLSTLISLRKFVGSSQDSTTQESQHRATIDKAHSFHKWLVGTWSNEFTTLYEKPDGALRAFQSLIQSASVAHQRANAMAGSTESQVLRLILEDRRNGRHLLKGPARSLAFSLLCSDFATPPSYRNDILGHDVQASALAAEVWASCQNTQVSQQYLLWAARVLGRAHNAIGWTTTLLHGRAVPPEAAEISAETKQMASKKFILERLADLLFTSEAQEIGIAEEALRSVLMRTSSVEELNETQQLLPPDVVSALSLVTTDINLHNDVPVLSIQQCVRTEEVKPFKEWIRDLSIALTASCEEDPLVGALQRVLYGVKDLAEDLFAPILHLVLLRDLDSQQKIRHLVSNTCRAYFKVNDETITPHVKALLNAILYLRKQALPNEVTKADRHRWLELDYVQAAQAAETCRMHTTALMFAETSVSQPTKSSRRSSALPVQLSLPDEIMLSIFKKIDELDSFYGVQQNPSLAAVLDRLDYEADGFKGLLFRGARLDSQMRRLHNTCAADIRGLVRSLTNLNLNTVTHNLLSNQQTFNSGISMVDSVLHTARKLEQWDIRAPEITETEASTTFKVFQGISNATDMGSVLRRLNTGFLSTFQTMLTTVNSGNSVKASLRTLGILAEVDDVMTAMSAEFLQDAWKNMDSRQERMLSAPVEEIRPILSSRETLFSTLSNNALLREKMCLSLKDIRVVEIQALISSCTISRQRNALQESLATATYLSDLVPVCKEIGLDIEAIAQNEVADVLWDQGEHSTSIQMLRRLAGQSHPKDENSGIQRSKVLAKLGHHVAAARLEQPEEIMDKYLAPAINELRGKTTGSVAGQVFHQFASFCDNQLQNPDMVEDFNRVQRMRDRRREELDFYENAIRTTKSNSEKARHKHEWKKIEKWYKLDDHEYQRLRSARESFMTQSLENYLLSLAASDAYDTDVLRFFSIWLEYADSSLANTSVNKHLNKVLSMKFARLMNQLSSRLQHEDTMFQGLLSNLILRIATDHPYHAMFHISAGTNSLGIKDESAKSRLKAAKEIAAALTANTTSISAIWNNVHTTNTLYHQLAMLKDKESEQKKIFVNGHELRLDAFFPSKTLAQRIAQFKVPPPTMNIPIRADKNYKSVPRITGFKPKMRIANGLSAPKILTAICSDGRSFKQLFKGGHDDLRQDAIMEQVFEEVSKILQKHTATRQRNLVIRTYKVLPLSAQSGIMEFVQNTMAMQDVLIPLHEAYFPKEFTTHQCRKRVAEVASHGNEARIKVFRDVMAKFSPVMRFFFFENFVDPDEWFEKRLAYTRSTAAISILGHIVGLGDRHLHNILLDQYSGEVVHIDLGVAFEAGRVLPVAEVVPFRLSRDLVDGMGYTKTEGVFRRCCEFTLDALREERESIMTLLNVLRYDPLYSWTVSPLKAKRLQETDDERGQVADDFMEQGSKREEDDVGEAGRALAVVEKKLSKSLSTQATVSELIAQATDERNLAVLFAGWSAWV